MRRLCRTLGLAACVVALAFPLWLVAGWLGAMPPPIEILGSQGLRGLAGVTVAALLVAAIGLWNESLSP